MRPERAPGWERREIVGGRLGGEQRRSCRSQAEEGKIRKEKEGRRGFPWRRGGPGRRGAGGYL